MKETLGAKVEQLIDFTRHFGLKAWLSSFFIIEFKKSVSREITRRNTQILDACHALLAPLNHVMKLTYIRDFRLTLYDV